MIFNFVKGKQTHQRAKRLKSFAIIIIITVLAFVSVACAKDTAETSTVDGVSDEVYEQLVQYYFTTKMSLEVITGEVAEYEKGDTSWVWDHELFEEAEKYGEKNDVHPLDVFPNPLFTEYANDPDDYTETEQKYIEKMHEFLDAANAVKMDEYTSLNEQLKEELDIKDSYNIFDVEK